MKKKRIGRVKAQPYDLTDTDLIDLSEDHPASFIQTSITNRNVEGVTFVGTKSEIEERNLIMLGEEGIKKDHKMFEVKNKKTIKNTQDESKKVHAVFH